MVARSLLLFAAFLLTTAPADAFDRSTRLRILPGSAYTYIAGFAALPDCDGNDDLRCDFQIEGAFTLQEDFTTGTASIVDADITLTSALPFDPGPFPGQLITDERVADFLEAEEFVGIPTIAEDVAYQSTRPPGFADPLVVSYQLLNGDGGLLLGGYDHSPVDGDGALFDATLRVATPGDYDGDGVVDAADADVWRAHYGPDGSLAADGNGDGRIDAADFTIWRDAHESTATAVPEPSSLALGLASSSAAVLVLSPSPRSRARRGSSTATSR